MCALNAFKPVVMDDAAYWQYARQIAAAPLDPYGFEINWYQHPQPANTVLAPPVFLYWLGAGMRLFGEFEYTLKWWLLPWSLLLTAATYVVLRRFARRVAATAIWMIAFSPAILPGMNFMLDLPCLALSLASLAVFGWRRRRVTTAVLAGLLAGLAAQTKYTGLLAPVTLVLFAAFERRPSRALPRAVLALLVAAMIFFAWEAFVAFRYGHSHFLFHAWVSPGARSHRWLLFWPLIGLLGGIATPAAVLGSCRTRLKTGLAAVAVTSGFALLAAGVQTSIVFGLFGTATIGVIASLVAKDRSRRGRFLAAWLLLEFTGYFTLSPWPAVRRVIGIVVVAAMIAARSASRSHASVRTVQLAVAFGVVVGVGYQVVDIENARVERDAVAAIDARLHDRPPGARIWFVGHLGWQHYAEQAGWFALDPDVSVLSAGDLLVVPRREVGVQRIVIPEAAECADSIEFFSRFALGTNPWYYGANSAMRKRDGPLIRVDLYQIRAPCRVPGGRQP